MDAGAWVTLGSTLAAGLLTAGSGFWAVVWSMKQQRKIDEENHLKEKREEIYAAINTLYLKIVILRPTEVESRKEVDLLHMDFYKITMLQNLYHFIQDDIFTEYRTIISEFLNQFAIAVDGKNSLEQRLASGINCSDQLPKISSLTRKMTSALANFKPL